MKKQIIFFYTAICFSLLLNAQKEGTIWYFGDKAGVDFNSGSPVALTDGQMNTFEGCATICDPSGSLLFYTDGRIVWDAAHDTMPNGTGLLGHPSSTQSAIIVPFPGDTAKYYVFTSDHGGYLDPDIKGINYSVVDMNLNGGKGDITVKNDSLLNPAVEKITAVQHGNGFYIWVLAHGFGDDAFYAWLVTDTGICDPVISNTGSVHNPGSINYGAAGYMKASPNGTKVAVAIGPYVDGLTVTRMELFNFNNNTGKLSAFFRRDYNITNDFSGYYGVEFSPNSRFLYVAADLYVPDTPHIYQYDVYAGDSAAIMASETDIIHPDSASEYSRLTAMQTAIDGKIYISHFNKTYLDVIEYPNNQGLACGLKRNAVSLNGRQCKMGLPTFITSFFQALPVSLATFKGWHVNHQNHLKWSTASETNNDYFIIERKNDDQGYFEIARIQGAGNSSVKNNYHFTDRNPLKGNNYYKLSQVDFDGKRRYLTTIVVSYDDSGDWCVIGAPQNGILQIYNQANESMVINVYNTVGSLVHSESMRHSAETVNLQRLSQGIYIINIIQNNREFTERLFLTK